MACPDATGCGFDVTATIIVLAALAGLAYAAAKPVIMTAAASTDAIRPVREIASREDDRGRLRPGMIVTSIPPP